MPYSCNFQYKSCGVGFINMSKRCHQTNIRPWMQQRQRFFNLLLAVAILFNFTPAYASLTYTTSTAMTGMSHDMSSACHHTVERNHKPCCQGNFHTCMSHCATFVGLLSEPVPVLQQGFINAKPDIHVDTMPLAHIHLPLLRPPRS